MNKNIQLYDSSNNAIYPKICDASIPVEYPIPWQKISDGGIWTGSSGRWVWAQFEYRPRVTFKLMCGYFPFNGSSHHCDEAASWPITFSFKPAVFVSMNNGSVNAHVNYCNWGVNWLDVYASHGVWGHITVLGA